MNHDLKSLAIICNEASTEDVERDTKEWIKQLILFGATATAEESGCKTDFVISYKSVTLTISTIANELFVAVNRGVLMLGEDKYYIVTKGRAVSLFDSTNTEVTDGDIAVFANIIVKRLREDA